MGFLRPFNVFGQRERLGRRSDDLSRVPTPRHFASMAFFALDVFLSSLPYRCRPSPLRSVPGVSSAKHRTTRRTNRPLPSAIEPHLGPPPLPPECIGPFGPAYPWQPFAAPFQAVVSLSAEEIVFVVHPSVRPTSRTRCSTRCSLQGLSRSVAASKIPDLLPRALACTSKY
jgi:hypothetical protein